MGMLIIGLITSFTIGFIVGVLIYGRSNYEIAWLSSEIGRLERVNIRYRELYLRLKEAEDEGY